MNATQSADHGTAQPAPSTVMRWRATPDPALQPSLDTLAAYAAAEHDAWYAERWPLIAGRLEGEPGNVREVLDTRAEAIAIGDFGVIALRKTSPDEPAEAITEDNDQLACELMSLFLRASCPGITERRRFVLPIRIVACAASITHHDGDQAIVEHLTPQVFPAWRLAQNRAVAQETHHACREALLPRTTTARSKERPAHERERILALALDPTRVEPWERERYLVAQGLRATISAITPGQPAVTPQIPGGLDPEGHERAARAAETTLYVHCRTHATVL